MECIFSVQFSCSVVSDSLRPHGLQHARPPCPSPAPGAYSNSRPLDQWCHPAMWSSVVPFSSRLQSFTASGSFPMSQFFASGGQSTGVSAASASVLPMNIQYWFPLGWTGWIYLLSKGLSRVFSNTTVQMQLFLQFFTQRVISSLLDPKVTQSFANITIWMSCDTETLYEWFSYSPKIPLRKNIIFRNKMLSGVSNNSRKHKHSKFAIDNLIKFLIQFVLV